MRGVVFTGDRNVEVRELGKPEPGPGDVVLKMMASGLCGSDLSRYRMPSDRLGSTLFVAGPRAMRRGRGGWR